MIVSDQSLPQTRSNRVRRRSPRYPGDCHRPPLRHRSRCRCEIASGPWHPDVRRPHWVPDLGDKSSDVRFSCWMSWQRTVGHRPQSGRCRAQFFATHVAVEPKLFGQHASLVEPTTFGGRHVHQDHRTRRGNGRNTSALRCRGESNGTCDAGHPVVTSGRCAFCNIRALEATATVRCSLSCPPTRPPHSFASSPQARRAGGTQTGLHRRLTPVIHVGEHTGEVVHDPHVSLDRSAIDDQVAKRPGTARQEEAGVYFALTNTAVVPHIDTSTDQLRLARAADAIRT
ncbi:hypothetical protein C7449_104554 [Mycoplana dimorpha]|uniref:Uncharacterized protein n=1 Tax=Mycoplana dimorpha TaxID=28320 RepID=A0A2T5B975_MYCDI|nr:hypothetical protein C7449_104554 [Mycoplana dimorpha]